MTDTEKAPAGSAKEEAEVAAGSAKEEGEATASKDAAEDQGQVKVNSGPPAKHPLEHKWTLWFDNPQMRGKGSGGWGSSLRVIYTFGTVEDFWCLFNNIVPASKLASKADMHLFKDGIEPKWEDPKCERGGCWTINCARSKDFLDRIWLHTLLALIGEQLEEGEDVCGAVVSIRPQKDRIAVWTKSAEKESVQMSIGKQLKEVLDIQDRMGFQSFKDQKNRASGDKYSV